MADAEISNVTILAAGAEKQAGRIVNADAQNRAQELREAKAQKKGGREGFRNALPRQENTPVYKTASNEAFKTLLGTGIGVLDANGHAEIPSTLTPSPEQKAAFDQGKEIINKVSQVQTCLELLADPATTTAKFTALTSPPTARPELAGIGSFNALKTKALATIYNDPGFQAMFPELVNNTTLSNSDKQKFIEEALLTDPNLRTKLSARLARIYERALDLKDVGGSDVEGLEAQKKHNEQEKADRSAQLYTYLNGLGKFGGLTQAEINNIIDTSGDPNIAKDKLSEILASKLSPPINAAEGKKYLHLQREIGQLDLELAGIDAKMSAVPPQALTATETALFNRQNPRRLVLRSQHGAMPATAAAAATVYETDIEPLIETSPGSTTTVSMDHLKKGVDANLLI
jgi:hypothetical protein